MPITVGQDSAKTRKTLTVGGQSVAFTLAFASAAALRRRRPSARRGWRRSR